MKKTQKILGLPIISISDGLEVGRVKSIIINSDKGAIDYIVVDSGIQIFSARVIPTEDVLGIGEYALTIENESVITDISRIPEAIQLLQNEIRVKGTKVLTKKGSLIGEIGDIYIDENDSCKISGLEFIADITQKKIRIIPRGSVITFGKNLTIVKEDVEGSLLDTPDRLDPNAAADDGEDEKKNSFLYIDENKAAETASVLVEAAPAKEAAEESLYAETAPDAAAYANGGDAFPDNETVPADAAGEALATSVLFEQRQRQYLIGRYATRSITDNMGNVIIGEGMRIDDSAIDEAKAKGKFIELVMNNRA